MSQSLVLYVDGIEAKVGDVVTLRGEQSTVEDVITVENFSSWGLNESGIMLLNASFGRVFVATVNFEDDEVIFLSRGE